MFFINLYNFLFGAVIIKITGDKPERFFNALINLQIKFWDVKQTQDIHGNHALIFTTSSRFARELMLKKIAAQTRTQCEIIDKTGLRWFLDRHKHRLGLYSGIIAGLILIYMSTFFIWEVKITKSDYPNNIEVIELLEKLGVKNGAYIKSIKPSMIQSQAILSNPNISWLSVNIKGTIANVEIKYREPMIEIVDTETPANIIASKSGKIIYIDAYEGTPIVQLNDSIQKGGLMISGAIDSKVLGMRITHAAGKVLAETSRTIELKIPLKTVKKEYTGNTEIKNKLNIFGRNVNLYLSGKTSMDKYDKIKNTANVTLFDRIILPMKILSIEYLEFEERESMISEAEAEQIALAKIDEIIAEKFEGDEKIIEITDKSYEGELSGDYYYVKCVVDCIENIAEEALISTNLEIEK